MKCNECFNYKDGICEIVERPVEGNREVVIPETVYTPGTIWCSFWNKTKEEVMRDADT